MEGRSKKLAMNTAILGIGTLCTKGIMFFMAPLFTRWLTSSEYGTFDLLVSYISLLLPFLTLSTGEALFRFLLDADTEENKKSWISTTLGLYICGIIIAIVLGTILMRFISFDDSVVVAFISYLCADMLYNFCMSSMRGLKQLHFYTIGNITFVGTMAIAVFVFVKVLEMGLSGILFGYAVGNIVAALIMFLGSKMHHYICINGISKDRIGPLIRYSIPMIPNAVSWWIINVFDRSLVTAVLGTSMNGIYAIANKVPGLCQTFMSVFHLSWQQSATEALSDTDRDKYYSDTLNELATILISVCIVVVSINYWFFKVLFSDEYFSGYYHAPILIFSVIFLILSQFLGGIYVARKESKKNGSTTIIGALTDVIVNVALIRIIGLYAASISTLVAYLVLFVIRMVDIRKNFNIMFYKRTLLYGVLFLYFCITCYFNSFVLSIINVIFAAISFIMINKRYILVLVKKMLKK